MTKWICKYIGRCQLIINLVRRQNCSVYGMHYPAYNLYIKQIFSKRLFIYPHITQPSVTQLSITPLSVMAQSHSLPRQKMCKVHSKKFSLKKTHLILYVLVLTQLHHLTYLSIVFVINALYKNCYVGLITVRVLPLSKFYKYFHQITLFQLFSSKLKNN